MKSQDLDEVLGTVHALLIAKDERGRPIGALASGKGRTDRLRQLERRYRDLGGLHRPAARGYAKLGFGRDQVEEQITARLKTVLEPDTRDWYSAKIVPRRTA